MSLFEKALKFVEEKYFKLTYKDELELVVNYDITFDKLDEIRTICASHQAQIKEDICADRGHFPSVLNENECDCGIRRFDD